MTEDKLNNIRLKDTNLRDAIRQEEMERPQMPANLNARLMQRVEKEEKQQRKKRTHIIWPWVAAACVAAIIAIYLTPPKEGPADGDGGLKAGVELPHDTTKQNKPKELAKPEAPQQLMAEVAKKEEPVQKDMKALNPKVQHDNLTAKAEKPAEAKMEEPVNTAANNELATAERPSSQPSPQRTLTERDIPVTHPENLKYTAEELALMKEQAKEAYLKWVELELEITKYNLEQTAQNR